NMHARSGLTDQIRESTLSLAAAEQQVLKYVQRFVEAEGAAPLAGNSSGTDPRFTATYLPKPRAVLHYRMFDVSSLQQLGRRWCPKVYAGQPQKGLSHRALADIQESIQELTFYRNAIMVDAPGPDKRQILAAAEAAVEPWS